MRHPLFFLLPFVGCLLSSAHAQSGGWKVASSDARPAPTEGVTHHVQTLGRTARSSDDDRTTEATLHFVSFDAGSHTFRVIDQNARTNASVADALSANNCVAGTNGGYFAEDFDPIGLLVCDGRVVHPAQRARLLSGALLVVSNHIELRRVTDSPLMGKHVRQAIQCGPFLVEDRKPVAGLNGVRSARRTAVFTDGGGRWGLVVCSAVTLEEFGAILADPALLPGGLKIARALNLDGGGSTALWVRSAPGKGGEPSAMTERGYVRDFIGIVPRVRATVR